MSLGTIVSIIFPLLTVISGGGFILLYGSTATLRATNEDQNNRIVFLEGEQKRDKTTIDAQGAKIEVLEGLVTGQAQLAQIIAQQETQMRLLQTIETRLEKLP